MSVLNTGSLWKPKHRSVPSISLQLSSQAATNGVDKKEGTSENGRSKNSSGMLHTNSKASYHI